MNRSVALALALSIAGCGSAPPTRFHTLLAPPTAARAPAASTPIAWELLPVAMPAQVDQPQLVVRAADGTLAVLENERWIAPLGDELHAAVAERLTQALGPAQPQPAAAQRLWRIRIDVQRFDSLPGQFAREEAVWSLRSGAPGTAALSCTSRIDRPVDAGYPALAAGHRQTIAQLADTIIGALVALDAGRPASCPGAAAG